MIYGEVEFYSFAALLSLIHPKKNDVFIDLGSGAGKACVTAALAFNIHQCIGIEIVPELHQLSTDVKNHCHEPLKTQLTFICDDFLRYPLEKASIIFINATAFFGDNWNKVQAYLLKEVPLNAYLMISSKTLSFEGFTHVALKPIRMGYGQCHINIYKRCQ